MAWEREKWAGQVSAHRWRRYAVDPTFMSWLETVPPAELLRWAEACLPEPEQSLAAARYRLAELVPMPAEIRKAFFFATTPEKQIRSMAGVRVELSVLTEHHICLVCQRLQAYHSMAHARHGPAHIDELWRKRTVLLRCGLWPLKKLEHVAQRACLQLQLRVSKATADAVMPRVLAAVRLGNAMLEGKHDLRVGLDALRPTQLMLVTPCPSCGPVKAVIPDEWHLPPFHPGCQCFRLAWRGDESLELERRVTLWVLEHAFAFGRPPPRFPFDEFIEACEQLSPKSRGS